MWNTMCETSKVELSWCEMSGSPVFVSKLLDAFLCWHDVVKGSGGWKKCAKCDESALFLCWAIVDNVAVLLLPLEKTWGSHLQITLSYAATLLQFCSRDAFSPSKKGFWLKCSLCPHSITCRHSIFNSIFTLYIGTLILIKVRADVKISPLYHLTTTLNFCTWKLSKIPKVG